MNLAAPIARNALRRIARRTRGRTHGPITRLMSPSDFGQLLKPFVFLDLFDDKGIPFEAPRAAPAFRDRDPHLYRRGQRPL
jgi:hypothetical protein